MNRTRQWVRELLAAQPEPPRRVPLLRTLWSVYREESSILLMGLGALSFAAAVIAGIAPGNPMLRLVIQGLTVGFGVWTLLRPTLVALRFRRAVSVGPRARARVLVVRLVLPQEAGVTVASLRHGLAIGQWEITDSTHNPFVAAFQSDAPWALELEPGSVVEVIVDPDRPTVLFDLRRA